MNLYDIDTVFEKRLLRIPDYQRGYAWGDRQINDFWEDVMRLDLEKTHYTGLLTLEPVKKEIWKKWETDEWLIDGKGYKPFHIVDGQQRLTTAIILIRAIVIEIEERNKGISDASEKIKLNYQSTKEITTRYILHKDEDGIRKSFLFGYEIDNPSDEYLKVKIFGENWPADLGLESLYTKNLLKAKTFFLSKLSKMETEEIAALFKKLTQKLKFNLYEIDNEIDVFVTFETMNFRGKQLSNLELLKNRLIYLSTLLKDDEGNEHTGKEVLRTTINEAWKKIYEYLGKNPDEPLNDDEFLRNHWIMYYSYSRSKGDAYRDYLLDEKFTVKNVTNPESPYFAVSIKDIEDYVTSLQKSIEPWFYIHNPYKLTKYTDEKNKLLVDRLKRLGYGAFRPLLLASYVSNQKIECINALLSNAERYIFTLFTVSQRRSNTGDSRFFAFAKELLDGEEEMIPSVIKEINNLIALYYQPEFFSQHIEEKYNGDKGFYSWKGLRYFLYEYEHHLNEKGKGGVQKISWEEFDRVQKDYSVTVEHIFPQTYFVEDYWNEQFAGHSRSEIHYLMHSLGNLLPLSRAKNSVLQNASFPEKKNNGKGVGYYNGSASENEVGTEDDWDAQRILDRGLRLLDFMEERWKIRLGDRNFKIQLLGLSFMQEKEQE